MRRSRWLLLGAVAAFGVVGCEDLIVGTETGNPNPRMDDVTDMMPTMPTSRPVDIVDMPAPGMDEPGTNEGGTGADGPTPSVSGSAPIGSPGGMGPVDGTPPGGMPGEVSSPGGQGGMPANTTPGAFAGRPGATSPDLCQGQCSSLAAASVAPLAQTAPEPAPFTAAECVGGTCSCSTAQGAVALSTSGDCALFGRGRNCLIASTELTTCDESILDSCADACAQAEGALVQDAGQVREVAVDSWSCDLGSCHFVVNIDGECFADYGVEPVECAEGALLGGEVMDSGAP